MNFETLIVDDDEMVIFLHKIAVKEGGLSPQPLVAFNGKQALQFILDRPESSFLVLLDLNMPEMDGWEFLDEIKKLQTPIYVAIVTSSVDRRDRKNAALYSQVIGYFEKPLSAEHCKRIKQQVMALI